VDDEMTLVRKLTAGDLELEWLTVSPASAVAGMTIGEANLRVLSGASIVAAEREGVVTGNPGPDVELRGGDRVALIGRPDQLAAASVLLAFAITERKSEDEAHS
jgi:K+/H+ antiporter YhaU regulatory subunit KhtT